MAETEMFGDKRETLLTMGEDRVRHLLKQQTMPHHLIEPAYAWLTELEAAHAKEDRTDAASQG